MWDLTVPGNNDHDFYVVPAESGVPDRTIDAAADVPPILVHNEGGAGACPTSVGGAGTASNDDQPLYRGVHADHPALEDAEAGNAAPRGGHSDPARHNGGNNQSIFTSWTTDPGIAYDAANEFGPGGVVLRIPASSVAGRMVESPDIYDESEVLLTGQVSGADVTDTFEFGKIWGFNGTR